MGVPHKCTGAKTGSFLVTGAQIFQGILVMGDSTNALKVEAWDSSDAASTNDKSLGAVDLGASHAVGARSQGVIFVPHGLSIEKGIWIELTGTGTFWCYYD